MTGSDLYYEWHEPGEPLWAELSDELQRRWEQLAEIFDMQWRDGHSVGWDEGYETGLEAGEDGE